jgi:hypothetical protein
MNASRSVERRRRVTDGVSQRGASEEMRSVRSTTERIDGRNNPSS